ncbi:hypothetical protein NGRA_0315 [Nosema granulosis]|uniref:Uncharacterized protein n=1 Tax=Nosema granulosis TaxID=83296 RepID=A0A9P6H155_9MICR|nr:hypothetical protein NGRA_0315 [Nosema granulosis]
MSPIDEYLGLWNGTSKDLTYIAKCTALHKKFSTVDIFHWYSTSSKSRDIKIQNKPSVSITFILLSYTDFLDSIDDTFLSTLLLDCTEDISLESHIELRVVRIINSTGVHLHKYIKRYINKLDLLVNPTEIIKINNDVSYYMAQDSLKHIKILSHKLKTPSYKENIKKYIESQGIINDTLFVHALLVDSLPRYISNVNIQNLYTNLCYKHLFRYIEKSQLIQKYFISSGDQNCILKYSNLVEVNIDLQLPQCLSTEEMFFIFLSNRLKLSKDEIQTLVALDSAIILQFLFVNNFNLSQMITRRILDLEDSVNFLDLIKRYGIELVRKNLEPKQIENRKLYFKYKKLVEIIDGNIGSDLEDGPELLGYLNKYNIYLYESEKCRLAEALIEKCPLEDLSKLVLDLDCPSRSINEFVVANLGNIKNSEIRNLLQQKYIDRSTRTNYERKNMNILDFKDLAYSNDTSREVIVNFYKSIENHKHVLRELSEGEKQPNINFVEIFLELVFIDYDFEIYAEFLPAILKIFLDNNFICKFIYKIQENIKNILKTGFFKPSYFLAIKNILNAVIKYRIPDNCSYCSKVRRNNDKIIIGLAYYSKYFDKNLKVGTVSNKKLE